MRINFQIFSRASTNQFIKQCLLRITIKYISFNILSLFQFFFNPLQFTYSQFSILNSLHLLLIIENKLQYLELDRKQSLDIRNFRFTKAYELAGRGGLIVISASLISGNAGAIVSTRLLLKLLWLVPFLQGLQIVREYLDLPQSLLHFPSARPPLPPSPPSSPFNCRNFRYKFIPL